MKKIKLSFLFLMIALLLSSCVAGNDEIVATVGEEKITSQELLFVMVETLKDDRDKKTFDEIKEQALKYLIDHTLFFIEAEDNGITVSENELKARFNSLYSKDKLSSLKKDYGITDDAVKKVIKKQISHQKYIMNMLENKEGYLPKEEQLSDLFHNNYFKAQHILVSTKKEAQSLYSSIDEQTDFDELALLNSEDNGIICPPGEYVVFKDGEVEDWFYKAVKSLSYNEVSEPLESAYGYHIIKRLPLTDFDIADNEIQLINEHKINYMRELLKNLKAEYKVTKNDKKLKQITVNAGF